MFQLLLYKRENNDICIVDELVCKTKTDAIQIMMQTRSSDAKFIHGAIVQDEKIATYPFCNVCEDDLNEDFDADVQHTRSWRRISLIGDVVAVKLLAAARGSR